MRISDWSSDVCSSDLVAAEVGKEFLAEGHSPHSPEARAERAKRVELRARAEGLIERGREQPGPGPPAYHVVRRVIVGTYTDGFIHADNLAYQTGGATCMERGCHTA